MKARIWSLISLLLLLAAIFFWLKGNQYRQRQATSVSSAQAATSTTGVAASGARFPLVTQLTAELAAQARPSTTGAGGAASAPTASPADASAAPHRLSNTSRPLDELSRSDTAILLRNAFYDTANNQPLAIPVHLRANAEPGAYVVQARGALSDAFRDSLALNGATVVSYIPNNAYLVRVPPEGARRLATAPLTQAILPYEPYFKLEESLLALAVDQQALPEDTWLNVVAFPGESDTLRAAIQALGGEVKAESRSPFGPLLTIAPAPGSLVALAALPSTQTIEPYDRRAVMNDLTRVRVGVAADSQTATNHLGLSGSNVWVNVNDTGVWAGHPDLKPRVFASGPQWLGDIDGHGTHVAGIIASSGTNSPKGDVAPGSLTDPDFRGMAPKAQLFVQPIDLDLGPLQTDAYLQETAARTNYGILGRTNALISNNSWGYPRQNDYNTAAASFDAAARDALPDQRGSQAMLFVFAAGNGGRGNDAGQGGDPGSLTSPATAKNVISVGAIDSPRKIFYETYATNTVTNTIDGKFVSTNVITTNQVFLGETDSSDEVAPFSSRGNVGIALEGTFGRFKPDVVAPGAFLVSTRTTNWQFNLQPSYRQINTFTNQSIGPGSTNQYSLFVPNNGLRFGINLLTNRLSATAPFALPVYIKLGDFPTTNDFHATNSVVVTTNGIPRLSPGVWYYSVINPGRETVFYDLRTSLELAAGYDTNYIAKVANLNTNLAPYYRYESGTSASAGVVSGLLALIQEFFEQRLKLPYSPALMKALLINGAQSLGPQYNFQVRNLINYQGWGLVNLPSTLPAVLQADTNQATWPLRFVDQKPTNALATGQSHTYDLTVPPAAEQADLKVTLVWTDPPGNPNAAIKLVNDLDLVVSNRVTGQVWVGNDIPLSSDYNAVTETNQARTYDNINNVENVFLRRPLGTNYGLHIIGRRVNVNAVTANPNGTVQDYALVVSISATNAVALKQVTSPPLLVNAITVVSNGVPLLKQRVGANSPLQGGLTGLTNQWHFYVFTNLQAYSIEGMTNGTNVAFITFMPPNAAPPRAVDADIDMYVSKDARLTNLEPTVIQQAFKSLRRGGTEWLVFTNAALGDVFYIGIKAEDQMAAEYGFVGLSSNLPFEETDPFGNRYLRGLPARAPIPEGSAVQPEAALVFAIGVTPATIASVTVSNTIVHNQLGDLLGNLGHLGQFAVLNNHMSSGGSPGYIYNLAYDDSNSGQFRYSRTTDGPGSLVNFIGEEAAGPWILTMVDNGLGHTGLVQNLGIRIEPNPDLERGVFGVVLANQFKYYFIDVPPDATNLTVTLSQITGPLNLYVRRGAQPTFTEYDKVALVKPPGGSLSINANDVPPLNAGRYFIGVFNPTAVSISFKLLVTLDRDLNGAPWMPVIAPQTPVLRDDATTFSDIFVNDARPVVALQVGLRVDHPRVSDLAFHLVSPQGTRLLLFEDRGGFSPDGLGASITNILVVPRTSSGGPEEDVNEIDTGAVSGTVKIQYQMYEIPDTLRVYYEGNRIFDTGLISGPNTISVPYGPGRSTKVKIVVNEGGSADQRTRWNYTATVVNELVLYTTFTDQTNLTSTPIKFAPTPFTPTPQTAPTVLSGFEGLAPAVYPSGSLVDGWLVSSNFVTVLNNGAFTGTNFLSIVDAAITRTLPTIAGRTYVLRFAYEQEATNLFNTGMDDFGSLLPGGAIDPHYVLVRGGTTGRFGPDAFVVVSNALPTYWGPNSSLSKWIAPLSSGLGRVGGGSFVYRTSFTLAGLDLNTAQVVGRCLVDYELLDLQLNGRSTGFGYVGAIDFSPRFTLTNGLVNGRNYLDFVCTNRSGAQGLRVELGLAAQPRAGLTNQPSQLILSGVVTNRFDGQPFWQTNAIRFVAATNNQNVTVRGTFPGLRFDGFILGELGETLYFPEESLRSLQGQPALGNWRLEVTDTRVGATNPVPFLAGWQLQLILARTNPPALTVTNGLFFTNTVAAGEMKHFIVEVPRLASRATNSFTYQGNLALFFNQNGLASGGGPGDVQLIPPGREAANLYVLNTNTPPVLLPGQRYYLGVTNRANNGSSDFVLGVQFDRVDGTLVAAVELTNRVSLTNTIQPGAALDYYQFTVSSNALRATFQLFPTNGNVDLYVRRGEVSPDPLPTPRNFDYASTNMGWINERVDVTPDRFPPLTPGVWYLGVLNLENFPVTYGIRATEDTNPPAPTVIRLTNNVPLNYSVSTDPAITNYFLFSVATDEPAVQFDLYNLDGDAELVVDVTNKPTSMSFLAHDYGGALAPAKIMIRRNASLPSLKGDWYLAVINRGVADLNFTIRASLPPTNSVIVPLTSGVWLTGTIAADTAGLPPALDYYRFTVPPNAMFADFEVAPVNGNVDMVLRRGLPLPDAATFDLQSSNLGLGPEGIRVRAGDTPFPLEPGDWYLGVFNRENTSVTYRVRATEYHPAVFVLQAGRTMVSTLAAGGGSDYFLFTVGGGATNVVFNLTNATGSVELYVAYGLPLPDSGSYDYVALADPGLSAEITLTPNSSVPLAPGDWYLSVTNKEATPVTYSLLATVDADAGLQFGINPQVVLVGNTLSFTWGAPSDLRFQVEAATNIPPQWVSVTNGITSATTQYSFSEDLSAGGPLPRFKMYRLKLMP